MRMTLEEYAEYCSKHETWKRSKLEDLQWVVRCAEMYGTPEDIKEAKEHVRWKEQHNGEYI